MSHPLPLVENQVYLPTDYARTEDEDTREATLAALGHPACIPCTRRQAEVFQKGVEARDRTKTWLGWRGFLAILSIPVTFTLFAAIPLSTYCKDEEVSEANSIALAAVCASISTLVSVCLAMLFTGTHPDASSNTANEEQNVLAELQNRFNDLGHYMLSQSRHPDRRREVAGLAANVNRDWLIGALLRQTTQSDRQVEAIFRFMCNVLALPSA
eukprot:GGOE01003590.1.p1 GENE.GGOE01003590.1~~GGOE01003590.1.p1  ORF type:complete len:241 (-),score=60.15 GGOE01003590.1:310-948(-)